MSKYILPSELFRKITHKRISNTRYLTALKYLPLSLFKLLENMPDPWEDKKKVTVLQHVDGAISIIIDKNKIDVEQYKSKWKKFCDEAETENKNVNLIQFPVFDGNEPFYDYRNIIEKEKIQQLKIIVERKAANKKFKESKELKIDKKLDEEKNKELKINKNKKSNIGVTTKNKVEIFNKEDYINSKILGQPLKYGPSIKEKEQKKISMKSAEIKIKYCFLFFNSQSKLRISKIRESDISQYKHTINKKECNIIPPIRDKRLLKFHIKNIKNKSYKRKNSVIKKLKGSKYFQKYSVDWLECSIAILNEGYNLLKGIIMKKHSSYLTIDYNFNLQPLRVLTTKERKKSRLGVSFHLIREQLKIIKYITDIKVLERINKINKNISALNISNLLQNIGIYTGIYRYKYRTMRQIKKCKLYKEHLENDILYYPYYRVWLFFYLSHIPLLSSFFSSFLERTHFKREKKELKVTRQRIESTREIEIKNMMGKEIDSILPEGADKKNIMDWYGELWRIYKSGNTLKNNYNTINNNIKYIIDKYIKYKIYLYISNTMAIRNNIIKNYIQRNIIKKNTGRITRLYIRKEIKRHNEYLIKGPNVDDILYLYNIFIMAINDNNNNNNYIRIIKNNINNITLYKRAINDLKKLYKNPDKQSEIEELQYLEDINTDSIKENNIIKRSTHNRDIEIKIMDNIQHCYLHYKVNIKDRVIDKYIEYYLSNRIEINSKCIIKDREIVYYSIINKILCVITQTDCYKDNNICKINHYISEDNHPNPNYTNINADKSSKNSSIYILRVKIRVMPFIDHNLLKNILLLLIDRDMVDIIIERIGSNINYKDMNYTNSIGIIEGIEYSHILFNIYMIIYDYMLSKINAYNYKYFRFLNELYFIYNDISAIEGEDIECILLEDIKSRMPVDTNIIEYSLTVDHLDINNYTIYLGGYNCDNGSKGYVNVGFRVSGCVNNNDTIDITANDSHTDKNNCNISINDDNNVKNLLRVTVSSKGIDIFKCHAKRLILSVEGNTYVSTVDRWNRLLISTVLLYRECITYSFIEIIRYYENKLKRSIKQTLNSKMDSRFPRVVFYGPRDMGALGMYTIGLDKEEYDNSYSRKRGEDVISIMYYINSYKNIINSKTEGNPANTGRNNNRYRKIFRKYNSNYDNYYFINDEIESIVDIEGYRRDIIRYFGGIDKILEYSLYKSICEEDRMNSISLSDDIKSKENKRMTLAQRRGLNVLPNRRFTLWWSPCINTSTVYIGYLNVLDTTGIYMHGKIPTLRLNYINIFRNNLWIKIHKSIVDNIIEELNRINNVRVEKIVTHKKKALRMGNGAADIMIEIENKKIYIDVQLRWGDYSKRDIKKYAKRKYMEYKDDPLSFYPCDNGILLVYDLCYNSYSYYGNFIDNNYNEDINNFIDNNINNIMLRIKKYNPYLLTLRERIKKLLEIKNKTIEHNSITDIYNKILVEYKSKRLTIFYKGIIESRKIKDSKEYNRILDILNDTLISKKEKNTDIIDNNYNIIEYIRNNNYNKNNIIIINGSGSHTTNIISINNIIYNVNDIIDVYGNWDNITEYTKFCRMYLIAKSISTNNKRTYSVIKELYNKNNNRDSGDIKIDNKNNNRDSGDIKIDNKNNIKDSGDIKIDNKNNIKDSGDIKIDNKNNNDIYKAMFKKIEDNKWIEIEYKLRDIIVEEYARRNKINKNKLTNTDIKNIILGKEIEREKDEEEKIIRTVNKIGEEIISKGASSVYKNIIKNYKDINDITYTTLLSSIRETENVNLERNIIEVPLVIIKEIMSINRNIICYVNKKDNFYEVIIPPQFYNGEFICKNYNSSFIIIKIDDIYNKNMDVPVVLIDKYYNINMIDCKISIIENDNVYFLLGDPWDYNDNRELYVDGALTYGVLNS